MDDSNIFIDNSESINEDQDCIICMKNIKEKDFPKIIEKALERKYCSNLGDMHYSKAIDNILCGKK